jgi:hypothetical protein
MTLANTFINLENKLSERVLCVKRYIKKSIKEIPDIYIGHKR